MLRKRSIPDEQKNFQEVSYVEHIKEFSNFYKAHRMICDKITGLKINAVITNFERDNQVVDEENFIIAIRLLQGFIYNNIHFIESKKNRIDIQKKIETLHRDFIEDKEYHKLVLGFKTQTLSQNNYLQLKQKYYGYLLNCFDIIYYLGDSLKNTLLVSPAEIKKIVKFTSTDDYFKSLSDYREEVASVIGNFSFTEMELPIKKVIGYYYTYKYVFLVKDMLNIERLIGLVLGYYLNLTTVNKIYSIKQNVYNINDEIKTESIKVQRAIAYIYFLCNRLLSNRNILPKPIKKILVDKSLI